ncbi:putative chemoreceptor glutamine deamidase CheD 1 [Methylogaea oryzae]|uniref:Probable chemoreceptor glutamine deamidase CheD n=2 Tax=Methylogaea oryzae TaxID=1295382 RepID=A0A8D5ANY8_9GAMM|nr:putative chemoreceptor glutamine deamidase CheD 1 [Methylogaea oryzae]
MLALAALKLSHGTTPTMPVSNVLLPPALIGFEHIKRGWDARTRKSTAHLLPGQFYVTRHDEAIYTTLGSCVAACIRDRETGVGGMNHFMLPFTPEMAEQREWGSPAAMYGNYAMEHLINEIMKNGGARRNLEAKVFGGGRILANMTDVGARNVAFVHDYLAAEGFRVIAEDVGSVYPRIVIYHPANGDVLVKRVRSLHNQVIVEQETKYLNTIGKPAQAEVDFF